MRTWSEIVLRAAKGYGADHCGLYAAGITYYSLLSLFPLLLFALAIAGFVFTSDADQARLVDNLLDQLPLDEGSGRENLEEVISSVVSARGALGIVGLVGSAWAGSALFTAIRTALVGVFHVEQKRPFVLGKAIDLAFVFGFGVLLALSVAVTFLIAFAQRYSEEVFGDDIGGVVRPLLSLAYLVLPTLVSFIVFTLMYTVVVRSGNGLRDVWPAALFASFAFEALKVGFAWYVAAFGNYNATYGTLGFVIALLFFIFLATQIMLLGAELARARAEVRDGEPTPQGVESVVDATAASARKAAARIPVLGSRIEVLAEEVLDELGEPAPEPSVGEMPVSVAVASVSGAARPLAPTDRAAPIPPPRAETADADPVEDEAPGERRSGPGVVVTAVAMGSIIAVLLGRAWLTRRH